MERGTHQGWAAHFYHKTPERFTIAVREGDRFRYQTEKRALTETDLAKHLRGEVAVGLFADSLARAISLDIDTYSGEGRLRGFCQLMKALGVPIYLGRSLQKGWRLWIFTEGEERSTCLEGLRAFLSVALSVDVNKVELLPKGGKGSNLPFFQGRPLYLYGDTSKPIKAEGFSPERIDMATLGKVGEALWLLSVAIAKLPEKAHKHEVALAFCNLANRLGVAEAFVTAWAHPYTDGIGWKLIETGERPNLEAWATELWSAIRDKRERKWGIPKIEEAGYKLPEPLGNKLKAKDSDYPLPYPVFATLSKPPFPIEATGALRPYIEELAYHAGGPVDLAYAAIFGMVNYLMQLRYLVWGPTGQARPVSCFSVSMAPSGGRKSATFNPVLGIIQEVAHKVARLAADIKKEHKRALLEANGGKGAKGKPIDEEPYWSGKSLWLSDGTIEGLLSCLTAGFPVIWQAHDEMGLFFSNYSWERKNAEHTAAALCGLWDGRGLMAVRAAKDRTHFGFWRQLCLTMMGTESAFRNAWSQKALNNQGIWGRFLFVYLREGEFAPYDTPSGKPPLLDKLTSQVRDWIYESAKTLLSDRPEDWGATQADEAWYSKYMQVLGVDPEIYQIAKELRARLNTIAPNLTEGPLQAFRDKATEHVLRIGATLHFARYFLSGQVQNMPMTISAEALRDAMALVEYHFRQLQRMEGLRELTPIQEKAKELLLKLCRNPKALRGESLYVSQLKQKYGHILATQVQTEAIISELASNLYLLPNGNGQGKAKSYILNPRVLELIQLPSDGPGPEPEPPKPMGPGPEPGTPSDSHEDYPSDWDSVGVPMAAQPTEAKEYTQTEAKEFAQTETEPTLFQIEPKPKAEGPKRTPSIKVTQSDIEALWQGDVVWLTQDTLTDGLAQELQALEALGLDTETEGLEGPLRLLQLYRPDRKEVYLLDAKAWPEGLERLRGLFGDPTGPLLCAWNWAYDAEKLSKVGLPVNPKRIWDGMVAEVYLSIGKRRNKRDPKAIQETELAKYPLRLSDVVEGLTGKDTFQASDWGKTLSEDQIAYAARDAVAAYAVYLAFVRKVEALYRGPHRQGWVRQQVKVTQLDSAANLAVRQMEKEGIPYSKADADTFRASVKSTLGALEAELNQLAKARVNWNNPEQVKGIFAGNGLTLPNTEKATLRKYKDHPLVSRYIEYKQAQTLLTELKKIEKGLGQDGRVRARWLVTGAPTGRMACKDPNLQAVGRQGPIRRLFRAPEGFRILKADYDQIELRLAAVLAPDTQMLEAFAKGIDLHRLTASKIVGQPMEAIAKDSKERKLAKGLNFGLIYGMGPKTLINTLWAGYGISITEAEAKRYREAFLSLYKGIADWHSRTLAQTERVTHTMYGRRREVESFTEALNTPVQGTGADGLKVALVRLYQDPDWKRTGAKLVAAVHDELVALAPEDTVSEALAILCKHMREGMEAVVRPYAKAKGLTLPEDYIKVEGAILYSWDERDTEAP